MQLMPKIRKETTNSSKIKNKVFKARKKIKIERGHMKALCSNFVVFLNKS
jgi:hypothetical protein